MEKKSAVSCETLSLLLQANSEQDLNRIFWLAQSAASGDEAAVQECARLLNLDTSQSAELIQGLRDLANQKKLNGGNVTANDFPGFPKNVSTLLVSIMSSSIAENDRSRSAPHFVPQLVDFDWRIDMKAASSDSSRMSFPSCLLNMKLRDAVGVSAVSSVNVEVGHEAMTTLLDGLGKIRDQLSNIAN